MTNIMPQISSVLKKYLSDLGDEGTMGKLDWDSLQWSNFLIDLFENQDPKWRDKFFQMAFVENELTDLKRIDIERLLMEARDAINQGP